MGDSLPEGLEDASTYPNLLAVLLERGYSEADIAKVCGENLLRVWSAVEAEGQQGSLAQAGCAPGVLPLVAGYPRRTRPRGKGPWVVVLDALAAIS